MFKIFIVLQKEDQNIDYRNIQPSADYFAPPRGKDFTILKLIPWRCWYICCNHPIGIKLLYSVLKYSLLLDFFVFRR